MRLCFSRVKSEMEPTHYGVYSREPLNGGGYDFKGANKVRETEKDQMKERKVGQFGSCLTVGDDVVHAFLRNDLIKHGHINADEMEPLHVKPKSQSNYYRDQHKRDPHGKYTSYK